MARRNLFICVVVGMKIGFASLDISAEPPHPARPQGAAEASNNGADDAIHVVLLADAKDHGPAGNGLHDYPQWQKQWAGLLGGEVAATQKPEDSAPPGIPGVRVTTAWKWPSNRQFETANVIVAYCYLDWSNQRLAQMRRYLEAGGGLVLIHSATWTRPQPSGEVAAVAGVGGFQRYRHGAVQLDIAAPDHPICQGLPQQFTLDDDETYWPPTPLMDRVLVLATSQERQESKAAAAETAQPMFWCYRLAGGRVFGCVPGHQAKTFDNPAFRTLLLRGIAWAAGRRPDRLLLPEAAQSR